MMIVFMDTNIYFFICFKLQSHCEGASELFLESEERFSVKHREEAGDKPVKEIHFLNPINAINVMSFDNS